MAQSNIYFLFEANGDVTKTSTDAPVFSIIQSDCECEPVRKTSLELVSDKAKIVCNSGFKTFTKTVSSDGEGDLKCLYFMSHLPPLVDDNTLIICFVIAEPSVNDLVIEDMRWLSDKIKASTPYDLDAVKSILPSWLAVSTNFVSVAVKFLQEDCCKLIFASLQGMNIQFGDWHTDDASKDATLRLCCERLFSACRLSEVGVNPSSTGIVKLSCNGERAIVELLDDSANSLEDKVTDFCREWYQSLCNCSDATNGNYNAPDLRKLLENYRLRVLQDLNFCNRLMKSAEADYYGFYRLYLFVRSHSNSAVLLDHLSRSLIVSSADLSNVITALSTSINL